MRNDLNYEVMGKVPKHVIVATARRHAENVRAWSTAKETAKASPYDFDQDRLGVWQWLKAAQDYAHSAPLTIAPPDDDGAFVAVIKLVIEKFKHFVEEQGGWKLLWNDGTPDEKPEEAAQLLFKGLAQSYCEANNVVVDREVNLGRGPVDFKFSNGFTRRALVEVKKLHNGRFWNGLSGQLPSYLVSDKCKLGWYVVIRYREGGASKTWSREGPALVRKIAQTSGLELYTVTVDAQPKLSASRV